MSIRHSSNGWVTNSPWLSCMKREPIAPNPLCLANLCISPHTSSSLVILRHRFPRYVLIFVNTRVLHFVPRLFPVLVSPRLIPEIHRLCPVSTTVIPPPLSELSIVLNTECEYSFPRNVLGAAVKRDTSDTWDFRYCSAYAPAPGRSSLPSLPESGPLGCSRAYRCASQTSKPTMGF